MIRGPSPDDEDLPISEWIFAKHAPALIDRLKTEVGGATFAAKIFKTTAKRGKAEEADDMSAAMAIDVNELLNPKKRKRAAGKAKAKSAAKAKSQAKKKSAGAEDENPDDVLADIDDGSGCSRKRWWVDDVLCAVIHAAGIWLASSNII